VNAGPRIVVPYKPRKWAIPWHASLKRWSVLVLHRRAGKTTALLNHLQRAATDNAWEARRLKFLEPSFTERDIRELLRARKYGLILPLLKQAKGVAWGPLKHIAQPLIDAGRAKKNESDLSIEYGNGSLLRLFGADNPDGFRGWPFSGVGYDEYSQHPPGLHGAVVSKSLADHLGFGIFAGTIIGKNQLYRAHEAAKQEAEDYFTLWQDVNVSLATETGPTITALRRAMADDLKQIDLGLMTRADYDQEWFLSPEAAIKGAIWGKEMAAVRAQGRIARVPHEPLLPVDTDWDLGIADQMTIWLSQTERTGAVRLIDFYKNQGEGIGHYVRWLQDRSARFGYVYGKHFAPHDIEVRELTTGKSRKATAESMGIRFEVVQRASLEDGINAVRLLLPKCWFDEQKTETGREGLSLYRWGWNEALGQFTKEPVHDWACVTADTFVLTRYGTCQIMNLPTTGEVLTPCGWKPYVYPRITRRNAPLVEVVFDDGLTVRCTPEHRFLTPANEWRFASDLRPGSLIQSSLTRSSSTSTGGSTGSGRRNGISRVVDRACTVMCGKPRLARFRRAVTSIIATETRRTTESRISNACLRETTSVFRRAATLASAPLRERLPQPGIGPTPGAPGIDGTRSAQRVGPNGSGCRSRVVTAARRWMRSCESLVTRRSTAATPVRPLRIASVKPLVERADVWCLTVPDGACFSLANGAVTHNSHTADAFRGLAMRHTPPAEESRDEHDPITGHFTIGSDDTSWMG
jgi:phage terminase large subunit